ncbi:hypothetical protein F2Q68_00030161 [Brassica cretica]|uniref:Fibrillarin n=1 Tax=Brassica cretica TaxID=69181 RepID=A0A8S9G7R0_BRACR|nr:hypothetical protein F2Q68_00030161 [Brassica cretica]
MTNSYREYRPQRELSISVCGWSYKRFFRTKTIGVFIAKGKEDALVTKNLVPGEAVYNEKRISVQNEDGTKTEYRVWNPFRSKLAAAILGGVDNIYIKPGAKVLYLGAASGTTVSHVSDIVGPARIVALNSSFFLKTGGHFIISIKANCIDSTVPAEAVFQSEVKKLQQEQFKPAEQVTLEPFERDHACVVGTYRAPKKTKNEDGTKTEYRVWNPFRSKLAAAILGGVDNIYIKPGAKVLYLGAASGTTVSHVSDIVGPARIVALNSSFFLKTGGHFIISIKANCIDSTVPAEAVFQSEVKKLQQEQFKPAEQVTLEPFERDHACVVGTYRAPKKTKVAA